MNESIKLFIMTIPGGCKIPGVTFANGLTVLRPSAHETATRVLKAGELDRLYPGSKIQYWADLSPEQVRHWLTNQYCDELEGIEMGFNQTPNAKYVAKERRKILAQFHAVQE